MTVKTGHNPVEYEHYNGKDFSSLSLLPALCITLNTILSRISALEVFLLC